MDALRKKFAAALALTVCAALCVRGQESHLPIVSGSAPATELPTSPEAIAAGQQLFVSHCSFCHGPAGEGGKGPTLAQPSLPRATDDIVLQKIIQSGLPGTEMPSSRLNAEQIKSIAAFVRSLGRRPRDTVPGDPSRGAQLYATKGACAQCHSLRGHGGAIGPDLGGIGLRRSPAFLRRSLVEPGAEVPLFYSAWRGDGGLPNNFLFVRAVPKSGEPVAGVRVNEDTFTILVRDLGGRVHPFFKADLAELHRDWGFSPMPAYGGVFTAAELDDVIAFLVSLRSDK